MFDGDKFNEVLVVIFILNSFYPDVFFISFFSILVLILKSGIADKHIDSTRVAVIAGSAGGGGALLIIISIIVAVFFIRRR